MIVETRGADVLLTHIEEYCRGGWIEPASAAAQEAILENTAQGLDADGNPFPDWDDGKQVYSPRQQKRREDAGLSIDQKDLKFTGNLLSPDTLKLRSIGGVPSLGVAENPADKVNRIAHGQMYHPKWRYHHKFLAVGRTMLERIVAAVKGEI